MENPIRVSRRNIFQKQVKGKREKGNGKCFSLFLLPFTILLLPLSGCGPKYTYPANTVPQSVEKVCLDEYQISVEARVVGKTLGTVFYLDALLDANGQMPKEIYEKLGKVRNVVTRVALSTDLPVDFITVHLRDKTGHEVVITQSMDDVRRGMAEALGTEESLNRTIFGPSKYEISPGSGSSFVLEEIKLEHFLADQIIQRIRYRFARDQKPEEALTQPFLLADGKYVRVNGKRSFRISLLALKTEAPQETILTVFKIVNDVLKGYQFTAFDGVQIHDYLSRQKLMVPRSAFLALWDKKLKEEDVLKRYMVESASIQEAFKLFGFAAPQDSTP